MSRSSKKIKLVIDHGGLIKAIYDDALTALMADAEVDIRRASHVEPDSDGYCEWSADMSPVGGPVLRGFGTRSEALKAEVKYLEKHVIT